jgi:hemophore-related protein
MKQLRSEAMSFSTNPTRLLANGGLVAGALIAAALFTCVPAALADQDPAADPPNCTAADLEGVRAGVSASTSVYLFTHPDFNYFMTSLEGMSRQQVGQKVKAYMTTHPDVKADLTGIRQPLVDIKDRCGAPPSP